MIAAAILFVASLAPSCYTPPINAVVVDPFRAPDCVYCAGNRGLEYEPAAGTVVRDDTGADVLRESVDAPRWRPSEERWREVKRRSAERNAEVIVAGVEHTKGATITSSARRSAPSFGSPGCCSP